PAPRSPKSAVPTESRPGPAINAASPPASPHTPGSTFTSTSPASAATSPAISSASLPPAATSPTFQEGRRSAPSPPRFRMRTERNDGEVDLATRGSNQAASELLDPVELLFPLPGKLFLGFARF